VVIIIIIIIVAQPLLCGEIADGRNMP